MRFGVNLYGPGLLLREDPAAFFQLLKELDFRYVEPCIFIGEKPEDLQHFWSMDELDGFFAEIRKAGLSAVSCHVAIADPEKAEAALIRLAEEYGLCDFVVGAPAGADRETYEEYVKLVRRLAAAVKPHGGTMVLHNGWEAIAEKLDGVTIAEWLLARCGGDLLAEPDVGYIVRAGEDPAAFLRRIEPCVRALHYKDFRQQEDGAWKEVPIGEGQLDVGICFQLARYMEVIQYVDSDTSEDWPADLRKVRIDFAIMGQMRDNTRSILCTYDLQTGSVEKLRSYDRIVEAPNWLNDGDTLVYNADGKIWKYSISRDEETLVDTQYCDNCNNDHVISPDNRYVAVSHTGGENWLTSSIYVIPLEGGTPRKVMDHGAAFLHGWSPDGTTFAYCWVHDDENGKMVADVRTVREDGSEDLLLTEHNGFNDGPEFTPDGKQILFISTRTGLMQVYTMNLDGSNQKQLTFEEQNNWFGHISPDGKHIVNLAYSKDGLDPNEHLPNMKVSLWMMDRDGGNRRKLFGFFGGQGSINVNSWAPDSRKFAFFMYEWMDV